MQSCSSPKIYWTHCYVASLEQRRGWSIFACRQNILSCNNTNLRKERASFLERLCACFAPRCQKGGKFPYNPSCSVCLLLCCDANRPRGAGCWICLNQSTTAILTSTAFILTPLLRTLLWITGSKEKSFWVLDCSHIILLTPGRKFLSSAM